MTQRSNSGHLPTFLVMLVLGATIIYSYIQETVVNWLCTGLAIVVSFMVYGAIAPKPKSKRRRR
jgi:chromate transport protein ChrA